MMKSITLSTLLLLLLIGGTMDATAGDAAAGKAKSAICAACHGAEGISAIPNYPNLACQKEKYLVKAIHDFKSGARKEPLMAPMVAPLSDTDIENLAAHFSTLNCK
jgi:cytochrome c553